MQPLQPLSVADVGLAARDVLGIPSVDEGLLGLADQNAWAQSRRPRDMTS